MFQIYAQTIWWIQTKNRIRRWAILFRMRQLHYDEIKKTVRKWDRKTMYKKHKEILPNDSCVYLYFQSNLLLCKYSDKIGTSDISVSCPPASRSNTFQLLISVSRFANTDPAEPPPTIIKSYSGSICFTLNGRFSGSKKS